MTEISLAAEAIAHIGPIVITNSLLTSWLVVLLICAIAISVSKYIALVPQGRFATLVDSITEFLLTTIEGVTGDNKKAIQFLPFLGTFFIYIIINNWFGLLPGIGTITIFNGEHSVPLFRGGNADINATLALAVISVLVTQYTGIKYLGFLGHFKKYFNFKDPITGSVGILEFFSEISKIISFSFRLFGNIFAGEVLLIVIAFLVPLLAPLPFFGLELFVGFIQAVVFMMLTLVFLTTATSSHEGH